MRELEMFEHIAAVVLAVRKVFKNLVTRTHGLDGKAGHFFKPWHETDLASFLVRWYNNSFTPDEDAASIVRDVW